MSINKRESLEGNFYICFRNGPLAVSGGACVVRLLDVAVRIASRLCKLFVG